MDLSQRMKQYEHAETQQKFIPLLPVYCRIDGRGFSKFTKDFARPFDKDFRECMKETSKRLLEATQAKIAYTQSDEINLCWLTESSDSDIFFSGKKQKMVSQLASLATGFFIDSLIKSQNPVMKDAANLIPSFDARVLNLPNKTECANMFLWREKDATRNALSMAARHLYSHKELMGKRSSELHELLFQKGVNFNDYPSEFKRGSYFQRQVFERELTSEELERIPSSSRPPVGQKVLRAQTVELDLPPLSQVENRVEVIFEGAPYKVATPSRSPF